MKKLVILSVVVLTMTAIFTGCSDDIRRDPGRVYMPDMAYSRAYETYANAGAKGSSIETGDPFQQYACSGNH